MAECNVRKKGMAEGDCPEVPVALKKMIKTTRAFVIPVATLALGQAAIATFINDAILDGDVDVFPDFQSLEDISQEQVYQDTIFSITPVKDGNYRFRPNIAKSLCTHKAMFTHRTKTGRVIMIDDDGWALGTEKTNGDFAGWDLDLLHTEKMKFNTGTEASYSPLMVAFKNNKEWDRYGMMVDLSQVINDLFMMIDVTISDAAAVSNTASLITVDIETECDGTPVEGLVVGDFVVASAAGVVRTLTTAVESTTISGRYALASSAAFVAADIVNIKDPATLSITPYQNASATGLVITIP